MNNGFGYPPYDESADPATGQPMGMAPPPTAPQMPAADPNIYGAAETAAATDPMAAETGMTRSAWSTALHEGMAGGKGIREIMAEFNPGMYGRYLGQQAPAAPPQNPYMPAGMPGQAPAAPAAPASPGAGQFGMGTAGMGMPPAAPPGFPAAPAQGMRPGPLGRLQQRMRPVQPGTAPLPPSQQRPPSRQSRKNSRGR